MLFPKVERVVYRMQPLDKVICQIRFSPILRIDAQAPADFQDILRSEYPNFREELEMAVDVQLSGKQGIPKEELNQLVKTTESKNYVFYTEDSKWKVNLTRNFLSLSSTDYVTWEAFNNRFVLALNALLEIYKPQLFTRIGLRYVDVINREKLGLADVPWSELIRPTLLGIIGSDELQGNIRDSQHVSIIGLEQGESVVRVVTKTVQAKDTGESCFMIDSDFFDAKKMNQSEALAKLSYFHDIASRFFRWCITERLHNAMGPENFDEYKQSR